MKHQEVGRYWDGNAEAWTRLVDEYQGRLLRFAQTRVPQNADAEDIVQDTYLKIYERIRNFDESRPFEPYLLRSVRWLWNGLTLNLGPSRAQYFFSFDSGEVESIVLKHLPYTLALVGLANILVFFTSITMALVLARKPGSRADRLMMFLSHQLPSK